MTHDDFRAAYLAGEMTAEHRSHLAGCADCRALVPELDATRALMAEDTLWEEPSPELAEKVVAAASGGSSVASSRSRGWWLLLPAAAAAIVGVVLLARPAAPDWEVEVASLEAGRPLVVQGWNEGNGTRLVLDVGDAPPAPDGFIFEFWMSNGREAISAGTFRSADDVELWSGVWRRNYPRLWVTLEPLDGDPRPSSVLVFDTG